MATLRVHVHVKPGPRHFVRRFVWPEEEMLSKRDFMGVLVDETPDTLGDRVLTTSGLRRAEDALKERYAANGHLDARVNLTSEHGPRGWVSLPFRFGVPVIVTGTVDAGPQVQSIDWRCAAGEDWKRSWSRRGKIGRRKPLNAAAATKLESRSRI